MEKKTGTAATKAKNKYNAANYERLYPFVKKGKKRDTRKRRKLLGSALTSSWKRLWTAWRRRSWENKSISPRRTQRRGRFGVCPPECSIFFGADY